MDTVITDVDVNVMLAALDAYEREPQQKVMQSSLLDTMFSAVLKPKDEDAAAKAQRKAEVDAKFAEAESEVVARKKHCAFLRVKLLSLVASYKNVS